MDKDPRTRRGVVLIIAVLFALTSLPAAAQASNTRSNKGQAVLQIRVNIVPALMSLPPPVEPKIPLNGPVSYQVPTMNSGMEMTEEVHPLFTQSAGETGRGEGAILKTLTIVLH